MCSVVNSQRYEQHLKVEPENQSTLMANRRVPLALKLRRTTELVMPAQLNHVDEATHWVSQSVGTHKKSGDLLVCLDPHELNKCITESLDTPNLRQCAA